VLRKASDFVEERPIETSGASPDTQAPIELHHHVAPTMKEAVGSLSADRANAVRSSEIAKSALEFEDEAAGDRRHYGTPRAWP